jgi:phospholipid/cholesterol/gamma-HCH transport system permease protein
MESQPASQPVREDRVMSNSLSPSSTLSPFFATPLSCVGRITLALVTYLGGLGVLFAAAAKAGWRRPEVGPGMWALVSTDLAWMFGMGLPLVGLVHVALGSFLAMQSYYGGTFAEGTGAVVGVGLFRNVAAMMSGLTLAGLIAARVTPGLRARLREEHPPPPAQFRPSPVSAAKTSTMDCLPNIIASERLVASLVIAATTAGPVLALWATLVGTLVGWQVAEGLMGVSTHTYFAMFWEMLWPQDVFSLIGKGMAFGLFSALLACLEGSRGTPSDSFSEVSRAACRAACFSGLAILIINSGCFLVFYHAGPAFGPTLLTPPAS